MSFCRLQSVTAIADNYCIVANTVPMTFAGTFLFSLEIRNFAALQ